MGTNYYAVRNKPTVREPIHIGKSSYGWRFLFQYQDEKWNEPPVVWHNYKEVKDWLKKYTVDSDEFVIMNEYDEIISYDDFINMVKEKQKTKVHDEHADNVNGYRFTEGWFI